MTIQGAERPGAPLFDNVGRDYDAEPLYWQKAIELADEQDRPLMKKRLEAAKVRVAAMRPWNEHEKTFEAGWFQLSRTTKPLAWPLWISRNSASSRPQPP